MNVVFMERNFSNSTTREKAYACLSTVHSNIITHMRLIVNIQYGFFARTARPPNACVTCEARPAKQVGAILAGLSGIFSFFFELSYVPIDLCIVHTE